MTSSERRTLSINSLMRGVTSTLVSAGMTAEQATLVAQVLVDASVRGHHSHGVELLPMYLDRIKAGGINVDAKPEWIGDPEAAISILDGKGGPGQIAMQMAVNHAVGQAEQRGAAVVGVRGNNHVGMLAAYRQPFLDADVTGLILNISGPGVAAPSARRATLGNGAVCLVSPLPGRDPFIADFATGTVASGKIRHLVNTGEHVPDGWLLDRNGSPSNVPEDLDRGGSVPVFGGHKGLCVALIVEVLAGVLAGDTISPQVHKQRQEPDTPMGCSQFILALDNGAFPTGDRGALVDRLERTITGAYKNPPTVHLPEQQERANSITTHSRGVDIPAAVLEVMTDA